MLSPKISRESAFARLAVCFCKTSRLPLALAAVALAFATVTGASATSEKVIHNFLGGPDGNTPFAGVIFVNGNMYGTTSSGGKYLAGTVYKLSPTQTGWKERVIYRFTGGSDGGSPLGELVADASGNLYGTTLLGGSGNAGYGFGTVFELSPNSKGGWTEQVLHQFTDGSDGGFPRVGLAWDNAGNLYGASQNNIVFRLSPSNGGWTFTTIYTFPYDEGFLPRFLVDSHGNLFGTSSFGPNQNDNGLVFELSPSNGGWNFTALCAFTSLPNGYTVNPGPLIMDGEGNLYGTTGDNGSHDCLYQGNGCGTVYELTPNGGGGWTETTLFDFAGRRKGSGPSGVIFDSSGNLYGATYSSYHKNGCLGFGSCPGTLFKLTHTDGTWTASVLHNFTRKGDGHHPNGGLVWGPDGNLYGTTQYGGTINHGTVYEFIP